MQGVNCGILEKSIKKAHALHALSKKKTGAAPERDSPAAIVGYRLKIAKMLWKNLISHANGPVWICPQYLQRCEA